MEEIIRRYFQSWIEADVEAIKSIFSEYIVYSECYGSEYRGLSQIIRWFEDWNARGKVIDWTIKRVIEDEKTLVAEWHFKCIIDGKPDEFDGVTVADFDEENRIVKLSEFESKSEHCFPCGDPPTPAHAGVTSKKQTPKR